MTAALLLVIGGAADCATAARAVELVPSYGLTRATDGDQTKSNVGLALRTGLAGPVLQSEIGVSYRSEEYYDGALKVKMIPVTASLLVRPIPSLHADAGVGWYHTNYDYAASAPALSDETKQQFGVHLGGGLEMPLAPKMALDLTGRYVFMESQESKLIPTTFDPDFWSMSLGLAFKL
ncbi:MAG TPA: outer membrane beta-barrel protein [Candidatus Eisenbacteria bacterium]|nr:outer membrane beta-barrel protein [Candidatus Eisenbacteria bacterium]